MVLRLRRLGAATGVVLAVASAAWCEVKPAPAKMQAAVLMKLLAFHKGIAATDSITVYVVGSDDFAAELRSVVGMKIGEGVLAKVQTGKGVPSSVPSVVFIGSAEKFEDLSAYTREHDVLSMTGDPELVTKGVTLGVGIDDNRLKVLFNAVASDAEGASWTAGLYKVLEGQAK